VPPQVLALEMWRGVVEVLRGLNGSSIDPGKIEINCWSRGLKTISIKGYNSNRFLALSI
jgi:hypothetical protein